ncbi:MAG: hypothetical protein ACYCOU_02345 [Sulfobacillus sp.]
MDYPQLLERACFHQRHATVRLLLALRGGQDVNAVLPGGMVRRPVDSLVITSSVPVDHPLVVDCARELVFYGARPVFRSHDTGTIWDCFRLREKKNQLLWDYMISLEGGKDELAHERRQTQIQTQTQTQTQIQTQT